MSHQMDVYLCWIFNISLLSLSSFLFQFSAVNRLRQIPLPAVTTVNILVSATHSDCCLQRTSLSSMFTSGKTYSLALSSGIQAVINTMCGFGVQTLDRLEVNKSIYPVGCADRAVLWIESHLVLVGALILGLALPQVTAHAHGHQLCQ